MATRYAFWANESLGLREAGRSEVFAVYGLLWGDPLPDFSLLEGHPALFLASEARISQNVTLRYVHVFGYSVCVLVDPRPDMVVPFLFTNDVSVKRIATCDATIIASKMGKGALQPPIAILPQRGESWFGFLEVTVTSADVGEYHGRLSAFASSNEEQAARKELELARWTSQFGEVACEGPFAARL